MGNEIGQRIRETRTRKGLIQKEIAERYGVADSAIRKYEPGIATPKYEALERTGLALGVESHWLMTGTAAVDKLGQMANEMLTSSKGHKTKLSELEEAVKAVPLDPYDKLNIEGKDRAIQRIQDLAKIPDYQKDKTPPESEQRKGGISSKSRRLYYENSNPGELKTKGY